MLIAAVGARLISGAEAIVDMPPVIGRGVGWIDAERLDGVDRLQHALDLRPAADAQQDLAAGTDEGQRLIGFAGATARTMSMRETTVPKSFDAQRTKAKMVSGAKLSTRRRRSRIVSPTSRPKLIQCSIALLEPGQLDVP